MVVDLQRYIANLEQRAALLHTLLENTSRPFVIEFAGTPKSGKSTSVEAIRHFFTRQGFRVHVLVERASVCPIPMKGHLFFNTWCASTMLAELLENIETQTDLIIVNRGIFDALVWLTLQRQRGELTSEEAGVIESFLLLPRWRSLIDLAVVMNVSPEEAMTRENSARLSSKPGSIMNPDVLAAISAAVGTTVKQYGGRFRGIVQHETSGHDIKQSNAILANQILDQLKSFADPQVLVVPRQVLVNLPFSEGGAFTSEAREALNECISTHGGFMLRSAAEAANDVVQIVACGILMHGSQVFVFERKERDPKYRLYGKSTLWQGSHVTWADNSHLSDLIKNSLVERITKSLFLSRAFGVDLLGYCWEQNDEKDSRHFGVMFRVHIDNEHTAMDLRKKEFRSGRGHGLAGRFVDMDKLERERDTLNLESWSMTILHGANDILVQKNAVCE
jgi:predicted NUDIX family phosphoesterase